MCLEQAYNGAVARLFDQETRLHSNEKATIVDLVTPSK